MTTPADQRPQALPITVNAQYIKDFSFENPNAPLIFAPTQAAPQIQMGVKVQTRAIEDNDYEVLLMLKMDAKIEEKVAFIAEMAYGGVFVVPPMPEEQLKMFLLIEAPRILFPFARNALTTIIRDGGFPYIMIQPVDFVTLYMSNRDSVGTMPAAGAA